MLNNVRKNLLYKRTIMFNLATQGGARQKGLAKNAEAQEVVDMIVLTFLVMLHIDAYSRRSLRVSLIFLLHDTNDVSVLKVLLLERPAVPSPCYHRNTNNLAQEHFPRLSRYIS